MFENKILFFKLTREDNNNEKKLLCTALSALACSVPAKADIKFTNKSDKDITIYLEAENDNGQKFDTTLVELKKSGETGSSSSITREKFEEIAHASWVPDIKQI